MAKAVAFDLISVFHVYSCLGWIGKNAQKLQSATLYLNKNRNGEYAIPFGEFSCMGVTVNVVPQNANIPVPLKFFRLICGTLLFFLGRIFEAEARLYTLHHTYFKPTIFNFVGIRDAAFLKAIAFEEGVGTYGDLTHHIQVAKREGKKFPSLKFAIRSILSHLVSERFCVLKSASLEDAKSFLCAVRLVTARQLCGRKDHLQITGIIKKDKQLVLFFTSPILELYGISEQELREVVSKVCHYFSGSLVVIKPHPMEDKSISVYQEMGVQVVDKSIGGEALLEIYKPDIVVGGYSGVLLVSRNVYGIETYLLQQKRAEKREFEHEVPCSIRTLYTNIKELLI